MTDGTGDRHAEARHADEERYDPWRISTSTSSEPRSSRPSPTSTRSCRASCRPRACQRINATYPKIEKGGSYPVEMPRGRTWPSRRSSTSSTAPSSRSAIAEKFDVDLAGRPKMYSLRGYTRAKDGQIHTDSKDKIITVLLYLNENWQQPGGRLRILQERPRRRRLTSPRCPRQRHAARLQALRQLLARPPSVRRPAPLAADELDDERRLEGLAQGPPHASRPR